MGTMQSLIVDKMDKRFDELKNDIKEQLDQTAMKYIERSSETEQGIGDKNEDDDSQMGSNETKQESGDQYEDDDSQNQELEQVPEEDKQDKENRIGLNCEFCDFKTVKKRKLSKHINSKHPDKEKPLTCNYCDEKLKSMKDIKEHLQREHDRGKYPCDKCGETLIWKVSLKQHMNEKHSDNQQDFLEITSKTQHQRKTQDKKTKQIENQIRKKLYCHYWNRGFCEKDGLCQYVHEDSPYCKYGDECYTVKCGFYHSISPKPVPRRKEKNNPSTKDNQQEDSDYASDDDITENGKILTENDINQFQIEERTPITKNTPDFFKLTKQNLKTRETSFLIRQYGVQSPHQTKVVLPMFLKQE